MASEALDLSGFLTLPFQGWCFFSHPHSLFNSLVKQLLAPSRGHGRNSFCLRDPYDDWGPPRGAS